MANKPISTSPSKHGRLREEEAARDKGAKFESMGSMEPQPALEPKPSGMQPIGGPYTQTNPAMSKAAQAERAKPVEKAPETLTGPMLLSDVQSALTDRYPHNDIHTMEGATIEVKVPTGVILVDFKAVNKCKNTAELRAYIDALPIQ